MRVPIHRKRVMPAHVHQKGEGAVRTKGMCFLFGAGHRREAPFSSGVAVWRNTTGNFNRREGKSRLAKVGDRGENGKMISAEAVVRGGRCRVSSVEASDMSPSEGGLSHLSSGEREKGGVGNARLTPRDARRKSKKNLGDFLLRIVGK